MANLLKWVEDAAYDAFYGDQKRAEKKSADALNRQLQAKKQYQGGQIGREQYVNTARTNAGIANQQVQPATKPRPVNPLEGFSNFATNMNNATYGTGVNVAKAVGGGVMQAPNYLSKGVAESINQFSPAYRESQEAQRRLEQQNIELTRQAAARLKSPMTSPQERARQQNFINNTATTASNQFNEATARNDEIIESTDPLKGAASVGSLGVDVATLGVGTGGVQAAKLAYKQALESGGQWAARRALAGNLAKQGAVTGATAVPGGALSPVIEKGTDATAGDIALGAGAGFAVGGLIPGATYGGAQLVTKAAPAVKGGAIQAARAAESAKIQAEQLNPQVRELDNARMQMQRAFDVETDPVRRQQISQGLAQINQERRMLTQGGYIGNQPTKPIDLPEEKPVNKDISDPARVQEQPSPQPKMQDNRFIQEYNEPEITRDIKTDIAVQKSLENANTDVKQLIEMVEGIKKLSPEKAREYVKKVADQSGIDISTGYPTRIRKDGDIIKPLVDDNGKVVDTPEIDTNKPKLPEAVGINHAVVIKENGFQRVFAYKDKDGNSRTFIKQKNPDGSWGTLDKSDVPIRSNYNGVKIQRLADDPTINRELLNSRDDGITRGFIWANGGDRGDVSAILRDNAKQKPILFSPEKHYVEGGVVRSRESGDVLGNYVQVGPNGVRVHVGKHMIDLGEIDFSKLKNTNKSSYSADRMIEAMTPDTGTREALRDLLIHPAQRAERNMKVEASGVATTLNNWEDTLNGLVPPAAQKQFNQDIALYIERKLQLTDDLAKRREQTGLLGEADNATIQKEILSQKYGPEVAAKVDEYNQFLRSTYDNLLNRMNETRLEWGYDEIPRREDYLTHIQELGGNPLLQTWDDMSASVMGDAGEGAGRRGALPTAISGQSEDFRPITKYNQFTQRRFGNDTPADAINPLREYAAVALHNIHMTEPAALARGFETALRAADEMRGNMPDPKGLTKPQFKLWEETQQKLQNMDDKGRLSKWAQEQANILSGKTASVDRTIIDNLGEVGEAGIRTIGRVSALTSRTGILGNASSVIAQTLSMPSVIPKVGPVNATKGLIQAIKDIGTDSPTWKNSDAMVARYTDANLIQRGKLRKLSEATGIPMREVEKAMVTVQYNMFYQKALSDGLKGQKAVEWATRESGKVVPWRSIGDTAHLYNNKVINATFAKFLREPIEQTRHFWKDLTPKQKIAALMLASAANVATSTLTGRAYLPDPIASTLETVKDSTDGSDDGDDTLVDNTLQAAQRFGSDAITAIPLLAQAFNQLPQNTREDLFGSDSELGRYDGALAITSPIANIVEAGKKALDGKTYDAVGDAAAGLVTGGSQIRKTMQGAEALAKGYTESASGRIQATIEADPFNMVRGLLFGKNALGEQQEYYASGQKVLGEKQSERLKSQERVDQPSYMEQIQNNRKTGKVSTEDKIVGLNPADALKQQKEQRSESLKQSMSEEDRILMQLSKADRQKLIDEGKYTEQKIRGLESYHANKKKELGYGTDSKNETKSFKKEYEKAKADFDKNAKKWSTVERAKKEKELVSLSVKKDFDKDTVSLYDMSKTEVYNLVSSDKNGKKLAEQLLAYGDKLVEAKLTKQNKFRDKYGNESIQPKTSSGSKKTGKKGSKGGKGRKGPQLPDSVLKYAVSPPSIGKAYQSKIKPGSVKNPTFRRQIPKRQTKNTALTKLLSSRIKTA